MRGSVGPSFMAEKRNKSEKKSEVLLGDRGKPGRSPLNKQGCTRVGQSHWKRAVVKGKKKRHPHVSYKNGGHGGGGGSDAPPFKAQTFKLKKEKKGKEKGWYRRNSKRGKMNRAKNKGKLTSYGSTLSLSRDSDKKTYKYSYGVDRIWLRDKKLGLFRKKRDTWNHK